MQLDIHSVFIQTVRYIRMCNMLHCTSILLIFHQVRSYVRTCCDVNAPLHALASMAYGRQGFTGEGCVMTPRMCGSLLIHTQGQQATPKGVLLQMVQAYHYATHSHTHTHTQPCESQMHTCNTWPYSTALSLEILLLFLQHSSLLY